MEIQKIRKAYRSTEQLVLILIALALPVFGAVYLYFNSGNLNWDLPELPGFVLWVLAGINVAALVIQYLLFHRKIALTFKESELENKAKIYLSATNQRFLILFLVSLLTSVGLLFFQHPIFVLIFAVTLTFFSLGKPSPDRMARLMKLKKEDRELIRDASRPE